MTKTTQATDIIKEIESINPSEFNNLEEYRRFIIKLRNTLGNKLKEGSDTIIDLDSVKEYIARLVDIGINTYDKLPSIPLEFKHKDRSKSLKNTILEVTSELDNCNTDKLSITAWSYILKSETIAELRKAIKLYREVKDLVLEIYDEDSAANTMLDILLDSYNSEDNLAFYKQQNNELIEAMTKDDWKVYQAMQVHKLNKAGKGRRAIAKELNLTERQVRIYLVDYEFN